MPTVKELEIALIRADAAGDAAGAKVLAQEIQAQIKTNQTRDAAFTQTKRDLAGVPGAFVRGMRDPVDAGAQFAVRGANALGIAPDSEVARVEGINKEAERDYQENWRGGNAPPIDVPRILGAGAVLGPALAPREMAANVVGRAGQAARAGAAGGAFTAVDDPRDNRDFFARKAGQIGVGGAVAAGGQPLIEMGAQGIANIASRVANRAAGGVKTLIGDATEQAAAKVARASLAKHGVDFNSLNRAVQASLIRDVQEALKKYGGVHSAAVSRQADFKALDIDPLKAWVTRDPVDFGKMKNLEATDAGDVLKRARAELDARLIGKLEGMRGPDMGSRFDAGRAAEIALKGHHSAASAKVTALYDAFNKTAPNVAADPKRLTNTILDKVEGEALGDFLSPGLRNLINDFSSGKRPTTPASLYRAQQVANREVMKGGNEGRAARMIVEGIDNELEQMGRDMSAVGPDMKNAAELLKQARAAHRGLKMQEEAIPALKAVAEGSYEPEKFLSSYVLGGSVREVAAMWSAIKDPKLKSAARSQIIDALKDAARGKGASDEAATFAQARFSQFLATPGFKEKLSIILGPGGMDSVKLVQRAAEAAIRIPAGTRYNTSGSAMELLNLSNRLPILGPWVTQPMSGMAREAAASGMAQAGPSAIGKGFINPNSEEMLRILRRGSGLLAPTVGGVTGGIFK
jgi:hypothetical protein